MAGPYFARFIGGPQDGLEKEMDLAEIHYYMPSMNAVVKDEKSGVTIASYRNHHYRLAHRNGKQLVYRYEG